MSLTWGDRPGAYHTWDEAVCALAPISCLSLAFWLVVAIVWAVF